MQGFAGILFQMRASEAHGLFCVADVDREAATLHDRQFVLADLIALGKVGVEIVLAGEHRAPVDVLHQRPARSGWPARLRPRWQPAATPGSAISTALACVFGAAPNAVDAPENIFDAVDSCACVSSPMTISQFMAALIIAIPLGQAHRLVIAVPFDSGGIRRCQSVSLVLVRDVEHASFREIVAHDLQAYRPAFVAESAGDGHAGKAGEVAPEWYRCRTGTSAPDRAVLAPRSNATLGEVGPTMRSQCSKACGKVLRDQAAHLLCLEIVGIVVAVREHIGADQDAALDFGTEALRPASSCTCRAGRRSPARGSRSARRRSAPGCWRPRPAPGRSRPEPPAGVAAS